MNAYSEAEKISSHEVRYGNGKVHTQVQVQVHVYTKKGFNITLYFL